MRGKVQYGRTARRPVRITPAYAGKRKILGGENGGNQDHPRLCGEKTENRQTPAAQTGSPPPMRGKAATRQQRKVKKIGSPPPMRGKGKYKSLGTMGYGITPAYAGKRIKYRSLSYCTRDHPRLCGEKQTVTNLFMANIGSPPPMRGKAHCFGNVKDQVGITPAYAGKSAKRLAEITRTKDHPRLCGEKFFSNLTHRHFLWITPAYAGKRYRHCWEHGAR